MGGSRGEHERRYDSVRRGEDLRAKQRQPEGAALPPPSPPPPLHPGKKTNTSRR